MTQPFEIPLTDQDLFGDEQHREATESYIAIRLNSEWYGVPLSRVREIIRVGQIAFLPSVPASIAGITNLRGSLLSVTDLKLLCGISPNAADEQRRIVIVESEAVQTGLLVDEVLEVVEIPISRLELPLATLAPERKSFITHVYRWNGRLMALLDIGQILKGGMGDGTQHVH